MTAVARTLRMNGLRLSGGSGVRRLGRAAGRSGWKGRSPLARASISRASELGLQRARPVVARGWAREAEAPGDQGVITWTYTWDEDNRLVLVELNSDPLVAFTYDTFGRMLTRTEYVDSVAQEPTRFEWDGWNSIAEVKPNGRLSRYWCPEGELRLAKIGAFSYSVHADALGNVRAVSDSSGKVVARFEYDAWGNVLPSSSDGVPGGFPYRFVGGLGMRWDDGLEVYYVRQRWYCPTVGRFIQRDQFIDQNLYTYVRNTPTVAIDSDGMELYVGDYEGKLGYKEDATATKALLDYLNRRTGLNLQFRGTDSRFLDYGDLDIPFVIPDARLRKLLIDMIDSDQCYIVRAISDVPGTVFGGFIVTGLQAIDIGDIKVAEAINSSWASSLVGHELTELFNSTDPKLPKVTPATSKALKKAVFQDLHVLRGLEYEKASGFSRLYDSTATPAGLKIFEQTWRMVLKYDKFHIEITHVKGKMQMKCDCPPKRK